MTSKAGFRQALLIGQGLGASVLFAAAQPAWADPANPTSVSEVEVVGQADALSSPLQTQPLEDTPQTVSVVDDDTLRAQGVFSLRDSLRNITGVSIVAGEGNPPSGDAMKIRGFAARDAILVDGMRDVGNYLRDPFFAETIEVSQGPSSSYAGRATAGGSINLVTRRPMSDDFGQAIVTGGTQSTIRGELDVNHVLSKSQGLAVRLNLMGHSGNEPGRDHVEHHRWGANLALAWGLGSSTRVVGNLLHVEQNDLPDLGLPNVRDFAMLGSGLEGRPAPVNMSNFYGYSTDYRDITADVFTLRADHVFHQGATLTSQLRFGRTFNDSIVSAPRIQGQSNSIPFLGLPQPLLAITPATQINGLQKPRTETDTLWANQTSLTVPFTSAGLRHALVVGFDVTSDRALNRRRIDINGPATSLFTPVLQAAAPIAFQGTRAQVRTDSTAGFVFDNIEFSRRLEANVGLRFDRLRTHVQSFDDTGLIPGYVQDLSRIDREWTTNASLVFHPREHASLYLGYATAFETAGRHDIVNIQGRSNSPPTTVANFNTGPERTRSLELGARWMAGQMELSGAVFQATKTNARTPGINANDPAAATNGEHRVRGATLGANGEMRPGWALFVNYTYLDGEVISSANAFEVGQRLDNLPRHSASVWTTYQINDRLKIGGGLLHVGERNSNVRPNPTFDLTVVVPGYTVLDAMATWRLTDRLELQLNLNNLANTRYWQGVQPGQSLPGPTRSATVSLTAGF